ncbi:MAG TPA: guanylate kinase [Thermohalobaculum sp.]|nr:guanylate kinase [Thermohalobaculum sp.]
MVVEAEERRGILLVLSSPSGAGKTTLSRRVLEADPSFTLSVSVTTRPPRDNEREGVDYFFVSDEQFEAMAADGDLLEHARVFGHAYGTPRQPVKQAILAGHDVLFDVDWQGAQQLRASDLGQYVVSIFVLPPSIAALRERLTARGLDAPDVIAGRMARARDEISHWAEYDYVLINDSLDRCFSKIETIVAAERLQWRRQRWLFPVVERLNREFEEMDR